MADPVTAMVVVSAAATGGKMLFESEAASAQENSLNLENQQKQLQYNQRLLQNYDMTEKALASAQAHAATRGVSMASPSLEAEKTNIYNLSAEERKNLGIEKSIFEQNIRNEKSNVRTSLYAQLFGDVASFGERYYGVKSKLPSAGKKGP
jgi:hypothetical protein